MFLRAANFNSWRADGERLAHRFKQDFLDIDHEHYKNI
jgi:hypothetical protein